LTHNDPQHKIQSKTIWQQIQKFYLVHVKFNLPPQPAVGVFPQQKAHQAIIERALARRRKFNSPGGQLFNEIACDQQHSHDKITIANTTSGRSMVAPFLS